MSKLLVTGDQIKRDNSKCYIAIFHFGTSSKWILGNIFLQNYYFVFDMTPVNEKFQNYL